MAKSMSEYLMNSARLAAKNAYCPYSKFHVGAAVLCEDGSFVTGCNVENASYGLTICAERNAIFAAVARGLKPVAIAVSCPDAGETSPLRYRMCCGACRQVLAEFLPDEAPVYIDNGPETTVGAMLPEAFRI